MRLEVDLKIGSLAKGLINSLVFFNKTQKMNATHGPC